MKWNKKFITRIEKSIVTLSLASLSDEICKLSVRSMIEPEKACRVTEVYESVEWMEGESNSQ